MQEMQCRIEDFLKENPRFEQWMYHKLQRIEEQTRLQRVIIHSHGDEEYEKHSINYANVDPQVLYEVNNDLLDMNLDRFGRVKMNGAELNGLNGVRDTNGVNPSRNIVDGMNGKDMDLLAWQDDEDDDMDDETRNLLRELFHYGYDCKYKMYCNLMEYGVIDPLKVTTNALVDANSVAGMMITTESVVVDVPVEYTGPPDPETTGEKIDPATHQVPKGWSYERELEKQWRKTERAKAMGRYEEQGEDAPENPWDLLDKLPTAGAAVGLPNSPKSPVPGTLGLPHPSRCEYGPEDGGEPVPDWLHPSFDMFEGVEQK